MDYMNKIKQIYQIIKESNDIVFFGGAGVSVESGIPDFRSSNGLYSEKIGNIPVETILSGTFFKHCPSEFYDFYKSKMIYINAKPNPCHLFLTELENKGKLKAIITQNIDGLHTIAKSKNVLELHGTIHSNYCTKCYQKFNLDYILNSKGVPICDKCGGIIKPDVVLYEEQLDHHVLIAAIDSINKCDTLIIGGTSLTVYPAAGLINYFQGKNLIILNKSKVEINKLTHLNIIEINENIGKVCEDLNRMLGDE